MSRAAGQSGNTQPSGGGPARWIRHALVIMLVLALCLLLGFAVQATRSDGGSFDAISQTQESARRTQSSVVSTAQVQAFIRQRSAVLIDARGERAFRAGHLPGAINWPAEIDTPMPEQVRRAAGLMPIVVYCDSPTCPYASVIADRLHEAGVSRVSIYREGMLAWREASLEIES